MSSQHPGVVKSTFDRAPWWVPWLFLLIAFTGWMIFQFTTVNSVASTNQAARELIRTTQIESCERVNLLRQEVNEQGDLLREFMVMAAEARAAAGDAEVAARYLELSRDIDEIPLTDCSDAFPEDIQRAGFG